MSLLLLLSQVNSASSHIYRMLLLRQLKKLAEFTWESKSSKLIIQFGEIIHWNNTDM